MSHFAIKWVIMVTKGGGGMNYHHDPDLAAWMVHMAYCPIGRAIKPEKIARRMVISVPDGSGPLEAIGRRVLADPEDIPEFVAALSKLIGR